MTTEQVLEKIKKERGENALRDGRQLMGLFSDYTKGQLKPQANALRTFLDCRGNERILNLQNASGPAQQTEYHRLVREMVHDYNMQEATAADVCAAFWKAATGTEPPGLEPVKEPMRETPAPSRDADPQESEPASRESAPTLTEKAASAAPDAPFQKAKTVFPFRKPSEELPLYTMVTLVFGFAVLTYNLYGTVVVFMTASDSMEALIIGFLSLLPAAVVLRMQYLLFRGKTITGAIEKSDSVIFGVLFFGVLPSVGFGAWGIEMLFKGALIPLEDAGTAMFGGMMVFSWYYWLWLVPFISVLISAFKRNREQKKEKRKRNKRDEHI